MANYGIKVSDSGKDISSTDAKDFLMWSKYPFLKTYIVGTYTYTFSSDIGSVDIDIPHNLGYNPLVFLTIDGSSINSQWITDVWWGYYYNSGGNGILRWWQANSDATNLSIHYRESVFTGTFNPTGETWNFKYYIFIDKGSN